METGNYILGCVDNRCIKLEIASRTYKKGLGVEPGSCQEKTFRWPGLPEEEIMICVHKGNQIHEMFHRQDFFFFNYALRG